MLRVVAAAMNRRSRWSRLYTGDQAIFVRRAVFEAVHGSAPDIAGKGLANPLALLMSAVMMLNHLAETRSDEACRESAARIKTAYDQALGAGAQTRDIGGGLGTKEFTAALLERL